MLIRYKKNYEKIAMGLLSFMPEGKDVKKLQQTIKEYETNPNWYLFLWKEEDVLGAIGVRVENDLNAVVQHVSVNPSHRNSGIGQKMVKEIETMFDNNYAVCADELTKSFLNKCIDENELQQHDDKQ
ncbi:GNAT family N-acetyltransferase RibT [Barrientosiimonas marina]|uniref:GNAT family N-acetyltransferase n=1 Tax=Lentibacillus kimchii TaxID=1542911 RepID=A0ABW2V063_9BACI